MGAEQINGDSWKEKFSWINLGKENERALPDAGNYLFMLLDCENRKYGVAIEDLGRAYQLTLKPSYQPWDGEFRTGHAVQGVLKDLGIRQDGMHIDYTPAISFSPTMLIFEVEKNPKPDFWATVRPVVPQYESVGIKIGSNPAGEGKLIYRHWEHGEDKGVREVGLTSISVPPFAFDVADCYQQLPYPYRVKIMTGLVEWGMDIVYGRRVKDDPEYADKRFVRYERGKRPTEYEVRKKMEEFESSKAPRA